MSSTRSEGTQGAARTVRLGTRGSALAVTQSRLVARAIEEASHQSGAPVSVELVEVSTRGDVDPTALARLGGIGVFAAALRTELLDGRCDLAVHSFKDLPTAAVPGLTIAAVPEREDPRDALCTRDGSTLAGLPRGARVGTGSPRRAAQLLAVRPDLEIVEIRGNVPTRLSRVVGSVVTADGPMGAVREPDLDAVVLALSGMRRLGLESYATQPLAAAGGEASSAEAPVMVPAAAQGALAVETRDDVADSLPELAAALRLLDDPTTRAAVTAERALMRRLEAGCAAPVGALSVPDTLSCDEDSAPPQGSPALHLEGVVVSLDGRQRLAVTASGRLEAAEELGIQAAEDLLAGGAESITDLRAAKAHRAPAGPGGAPRQATEGRA